MTLKATLTASYTASVTLTTAAYANPVTITGAIDVTNGNALYGAAPPAWSISNQGTIEATGTGVARGYGVDLSAGGSIDNAASAIISGYYGVYVAGGAGTVSNGAAATIAGAFAGLGFRGTGTVVNSGSIIGANSRGVFLRGGDIQNLSGGTVTAPGFAIEFTTDVAGTVTNAAGGAILENGSFSGAAIYFANASAAIVNAGTIGALHDVAIRGFAGGTLSNAAGGTISGGSGGIDLVNGTASVDNAGLVQSSGGFAVELTGGASDAAYVRNTGSLIGGGNGGVRVSSVPGTLVNSGGVNGVGGHDGVDFYDGGSVTNMSGGSIAGLGTVDDGVFIDSTPGTVVNQGQITSPNYTGVYIFSTGAITNMSGGSIAGSPTAGRGVALHGGGTVTNAASATISGATGIAALTSAGNVDNSGTVLATGTAGASFTTGVYLKEGGSVTNASSGVISGYDGVLVRNAPGVVINAGTIEAPFSGTRAGGVYLHGGTLVNSGTIVATGSTAAAVYFGAGENARLVIDPGAVFAGLIDGGNSIGAAAVSVLELNAGNAALTGLGSSITNFGSIAFDAGADWMVSGTPLALAGGETISGFAAGSTLQLTGVNETLSGFANGTLSLTGDEPLSMLLPGSFTTSFVVADSGPDTDITLACFAAGTRILTATGEVPVEALREGMRVVSLTHRRAAAMRWVGWQRSRVPAVRIAPGAFGNGLPHRSLRLSPDHAIFVDGALIPVRTLVNGATIRETACAAITYFHVELDEHAVLLAEGLAVESYLDTGNRNAFEDARGHCVIAEDCIARHR